jgi:hypothetical protein
MEKLAVTVDKVEPYLEPLMVPVLVEIVFWFFVLVFGPFDTEMYDWVINVYRVVHYSVPVLVLLYEILLWLKVVKPRALIKSTHPAFLKLRWIVVVIGLYVTMWMLKGAVDGGYSSLYNLYLHYAYFPNNPGF